MASLRLKKGSESLEQAAFFDYFSRYRLFDYILFAVPNGGSRHIVEAVNLKKQGVRAGVWDVFLAYPTDKSHGLWIEFKWGKNKLSKNQEIFGEKVKKLGFSTEICYSCQEGIDAVKRYLGGNDAIFRKEVA